MGQGLGAQLDAYPALLTLSLDANLRPTADALRDAGLLPPPASGEGAPPTALRPRHLAASLDKRVRPRVAYCEMRRAAELLGGEGEEATVRAQRLLITPDWRCALTGPAFEPFFLLGQSDQWERWVGASSGRAYPSLSMVTTISDAAFAAQLGVDLPEYLAFRSAWLDRQGAGGAGGGAAGKGAGAAGGGEGALNIPWLPEGFDLEGLLAADA